MLRLMISCGGTGGHFYPGLSLAEKLRSDGGDVLLLLSGANADRQAAIAAAAGIAAVALPAMPNPRKPANWFRFIGGAMGGYRRSAAEIGKFRPDAMLGMGSFASLPPLLAALSGRIPVFLHDGNARIGRANRWFSRKAKMLFTAFPPVNAGAAHCPVQVSGMPIRPELAGYSGDRRTAAAFLNEKYGWNLDESSPVLLVMGGSQGARAINVTASAAAAELRQGGKKFQLIHLCGDKLYNETEQLYRKLDFRAFLLPSSPHMAELYTVCDFVFCRSGGSSVAELATFGKYGVLCPYPFAAELHQNDNAAAYKASGSAEIIRNDALTVEAVREIFERLLGDVSGYLARGCSGKTGLHRLAPEFILAHIAENAARS